MQAAEPDWQCRFGDDCVYKRVVRPQTAAAGTKRRGVTRGGYVDGGVATAGASAEEDPAKGSKARAKPEWPAAVAAAAAGEKASAAAAVAACNSSSKQQQRVATHRTAQRNFSDQKRKCQNNFFFSPLSLFLAHILLLYSTSLLDYGMGLPM